MFSRLLECEDLALHDVSSLKKGILAGSACAPGLVADIVNGLGMSGICVSYGQTETSPCCTQTEPDDSIEVKSRSVGKPLPFVEMKIIDPNTGRELPPNKAGELCTRGYHVMLGYFRAAHATEKTIDKDGWLHTGDVGFADAEGRCHFVDRLKEIIIRGGENISPQEIECIVLEHPSVRSAKVYGVPSDDMGEEVAVSVALREGCGLERDELCAFLAPRLARYKLPKYLDLRDSLPLTASGKIDVCELKNCLVRKLEGGEASAQNSAALPNEIKNPQPERSTSCLPTKLLRESK
jgi:fatty-acyl-CoA synthase